jgi:hypothetical protein
MIYTVTATVGHDKVTLRFDDVGSNFQGKTACNKNLRLEIKIEIKPRASRDPNLYSLLC